MGRRDYQLFKLGDAQPELLLESAVIQAQLLQKMKELTMCDHNGNGLQKNLLNQ